MCAVALIFYVPSSICIRNTNRYYICVGIYPYSSIQYAALHPRCGLFFFYLQIIHSYFQSDLDWERETWVFLVISLLPVASLFFFISILHSYMYEQNIQFINKFAFCLYLEWIECHSKFTFVLLNVTKNSELNLKKNVYFAFYTACMYNISRVFFVSYTYT